MIRYLCNPFYIYSIGFLIAILLLSLNISNLYHLEYGYLLIFILSTIVVSLFIGYIIKDYLLRKIIKSFELVGEVSTRNCILIVSFLIVLFLLDCMSVGVIPIVEVVKGNSYRYTEFGVPILHAFFIMYISIICFSYFIRWLKFNKRIYLIVAVFSLFMPIFFINRQVFVYEIIGLFLLYFVFKRNIDIKFFLRIVVVMLFIISFFSLIGNLRTVSDSSGTVESDSSLISNLLDVNTKYMPDILSWPYAYIVTPYGNLQYNFIIKSRDEYSFSDLSKAVRLEILPDFISKRVVDDFELQQSEPLLVSEVFNVVTAYSRIYVIFGVYGLFLYFLYFCTLILLFIYFSPTRGFFISIAGLSATTYLLTYSNTLYQFTQILFPIFVIFLTKFKFGKFSFV